MTNAPLVLETDDWPVSAQLLSLLHSTAGLSHKKPAFIGTPSDNDGCQASDGTAGLFETHGHPVPRICCVNLKLSHRLAICKLANRASFAPPSKARTKIEAPWRQKDVIMDQFREELMTPECQLIGECKYNLLRPLCERAVRNFISIMEMRISGSFLCWCPEFSVFIPNENTNKHSLLLIRFSLYTSVYAAYGRIQVKSQL